MKLYRLTLTTVTVTLSLFANAQNKIESTGNIGIGTTNPLAPLHIVGGDGNTLLLQKPNTNVPGITWQGANYFSVLEGGDYFNFYTNGLSRMRINADGNVGIGINNPFSQLHLASDVSHSFNISRTDGTYGFRIYRDATYGKVLFQIGITPSAWETKIQIGEGEGVNTNLLLNPSGGKIGIGITNPQATLDVIGNIKSTNGKIDNGGYWQGFYSPAPSGTWAINQSDRAFFGMGGNLYSRGFSANAMGIMNGSTTAEDIFLFNRNDGNAGFLVLKANDNVGIGTASPTEKLSVNGNIRSKKITVTQQNWPDYVFDSSYTLQPLSQVEQFIKDNKHLPDVPSAKEVADKGLDVGDNQAVLLKKIEELTLYMIEMKKENEEVRKQLESQELKFKKEIEELKFKSKEQDEKVAELKKKNN
ncbi:hypothetical protein ACI6Q2_10625 [Chitinophagaceae bacterium LWZ2-11]